MKCLIVVDMQNDFIDGSLGTKEASEVTLLCGRYVGELQRLPKLTKMTFTAWEYGKQATIMS